MRTFIEDYLKNPSEAIVDAKTESDALSWYDEISDDVIYSQLTSAEFRLYEEIIFSDYSEEEDARYFASY